jgi:isopentenyl diphosphate isomerase/L-lactate dehydrogenase-like FMN-dependent dehydrogenase
MVFLGRAPLYGASAGAEEGVLRALELLKSEVDRVMTLIGCPTVHGLGFQYLRIDDSGTIEQAPPSGSLRQAI